MQHNKFSAKHEKKPNTTLSEFSIFVFLFSAAKKRWISPLVHRTSIRALYSDTCGDVSFRFFVRTSEQRVRVNTGSRTLVYHVYMRCWQMYSPVAAALRVWVPFLVYLFSRNARIELSEQVIIFSFLGLVICAGACCGNRERS